MSRVLPYNAKQWEIPGLLDGRKTVTRRLPSKRTESKWYDYEEYVRMVAPPGSTSLNEKQFYKQYPPYQPGDILYIRETWCPHNAPTGIWYGYKSDGDYRDVDLKWRPSIHMPKAAARIWLKVTDVRVERLQDITDEQAKAEGANWRNGKNVGWEEKMRHTAVERFAEIWNSTIKKSDLDLYGWDANPYVWVIGFERCEKPELMEEEHEKP